eukprot:scaffold270189_cov21-Tisochrysis_lutea.AAC.1
MHAQQHGYGQGKHKVYRCETSRINSSMLVCTSSTERRPLYSRQEAASNKEIEHLPTSPPGSLCAHSTELHQSAPAALHLNSDMWHTAHCCPPCTPLTQWMHVTGQTSVAIWMSSTSSPFWLNTRARPIGLTNAADLINKSLVSGERGVLKWVDGVVCCKAAQGIVGRPLLLVHQCVVLQQGQSRGVRIQRAPQVAG